MLKRNLTTGTKIVGIISGLLLLSSLSGCASFQKIFKPEPTPQQIRARREAANRLHRQNIRNEYKSANLLQTDLTEGAAKRSYILPNGEHYNG